MTDFRNFLRNESLKFFDPTNRFLHCDTCVYTGKCEMVSLSPHHTDSPGLKIVIQKSL